jgi:hypothetical protein
MLTSTFRQHKWQPWCGHRRVWAPITTPTRRSRRWDGPVSTPPQGMAQMECVNLLHLQPNRSSQLVTETICYAFVVRRRAGGWSFVRGTRLSRGNNSLFFVGTGCQREEGGVWEDKKAERVFPDFVSSPLVETHFASFASEQFKSTARCSGCCRRPIWDWLTKTCTGRALIFQPLHHVTSCGVGKVSWMLCTQTNPSNATS